jgi:putative FmdB family regulatory protein
MPIYSYRCDHCGVQFDRKQKFSDEPLKICPECGEEKLRKLYLPVGIVFKGSGFYATDHRSPSGQKTSGKADRSESATESIHASKSDNKKPSSENTSSKSSKD